MAMSSLNVVPMNKNELLILCKIVVTFFKIIFLFERQNGDISQHLHSLVTHIFLPEFIIISNTHLQSCTC